MKLKHHAFVTEYLKHRDAYLAYVHVYNVQSDNYTATLSSANRLLNRPDISAAIQSVQDAIRADVEYELRQELKKELLTVQRKRELLAQIATGEMYVMQYYKGKDCSHCSQHVAPTINQMLRAIDLDSRLAGHYPNTKHQSQQITTKEFPSSGGVRGGLLAQESPEPQQITTKEFPSSGGVRGGLLAQEVPEPQQITTNELPSLGGVRGGLLAQESPESPESQQITTNDIEHPSRCKREVGGGLKRGTLNVKIPIVKLKAL